MNNIKRYQMLYRLENYYKTNHNTGLVYQSDFELLIATLLSAQSRDVQVNQVTTDLFKVANTPQSMLSLGVDGLKNYIKCIGLFNIKADRIIKTCQLLITKYNGVIPGNRFDLESLPGVGRKTANIILNIVFGRLTIAVDTHVFRVCNRSQFATGINVISVEQKLISVVPKKFKKHCHQWLVDHGRSICKSKKPNCCNCIIQDLCEFKSKIIPKLTNH